MRVVSKCLEETREVAGEFLQTLPGVDETATVVALVGELGAGKTTFVQQVGDLLAVKGRVTSPTFSLIQTYKLPKIFKSFRHLVHIDCYRLESAQELVDLDWLELVADPQNLIFIEWPERVKEILPSGTKTIKFRFIDDQTREIKTQD